MYFQKIAATHTDYGIQLKMNIDFDTGSHAHPMSSWPSLQALKERRVRALVARQPIAVCLRGLPREHARTVSDILVPQIRRSPFRQEGTWVISP